MKVTGFTGVVAVIDVAVVAYVEKVLIAGHKATAGHPAVLPAAPKELVIVGLIFALPALLVILVAWLRGRGATVPAESTSRLGGYPYRTRL